MHVSVTSGEGLIVLCGPVYGETIMADHNVSWTWTQLFRMHITNHTEQPDGLNTYQWYSLMHESSWDFADYSG